MVKCLNKISFIKKAEQGLFILNNVVAPDAAEENFAIYFKGLPSIVRYFYSTPLKEILAYSEGL